MNSRLTVLFSTTLIGMILTGCVYGDNQQFFEAPASAGISTDPVLPSAPGNTPIVTPVPGTPTPTPNSSICIDNPTAAACDETPAVTTAGVVTILFTMSQIPQASGTLILANAIKYASPMVSPKILFVKDFATNGEDEGDPDYIKNTLLAGYNVQYGEILPGGLDPSDTVGFDLVIVSNPGWPLSDPKTLTTLQGFSGGVILVGDDLSQGAGFDISSLTGLQFNNNGTSMSCGGQTYSYDNENGYSYQVAMNADFLPGIPAQYMNYQYGNDLDWTTPLAATEVLAWATAAPGTCDIGIVPAVARHEK